MMMGDAGGYLAGVVATLMNFLNIFHHERSERPYICNTGIGDEDATD